MVDAEALIRMVEGGIVKVFNDRISKLEQVASKAAFNVNALVDVAHGMSLEKGWWIDEPTQAERVKAIPEKLALIHSEVSEALEEYRGGDIATTRYTGATNKPEGFAIELADVVIRIADLCGAIGLDLDAALKVKLAYNGTRPFRHGGKKC